MVFYGFKKIIVNEKIILRKLAIISFDKTSNVKKFLIVSKQFAEHPIKHFIKQCSVMKNY